MATFKVTGPDGHQYKVTAPDDASQQDVIDRVRAVSVSDDMEKYGKMGAGELAKTAVSNIPSSAAGLVGGIAKGVAQAVTSPVETATAFGNIGKGVLQKLGIMSGKDAEPYADAVGKMLMERYGSGAVISRTLATDPVGMAADIATVLTGVGGLTGLAARAGGTVARVGEAASTVGRAVDPLSAVGVAGKLGGKVSAKLLGLSTGAGGESIGLAAQAGAEGGAAGQALRGGMSGTVTGQEVVNEARGAVKQLRKERGKLYNEDMKKLGTDTTVLDFSKIDKAVSDAAGIKKFKGVPISAEPTAVHKEIMKKVNEWKALDPANYHTPEGIDALKQAIGGIRDNTPFNDPARVVADKVYHAVRQTIVDQVPEYAKYMKGYEEASEQIREIEKTLSLGGPKVNIDTALRKLQSTLRNNVNTNYGRRKELADFLVNSGAPHLMEKLAGMSLSSATPRGLATGVAGGEFLGSIVALIHGDPTLAASLFAGLAASSPRLVGTGAYLTGAATRLPLRQLGQSVLQTGRIKDAAGNVYPGGVTANQP